MCMLHVELLNRRYRDKMRFRPIMGVSFGFKCDLFPRLTFVNLRGLVCAGHTDKLEAYISNGF